MKNNYESLTKLVPILLGMGGAFYLINQFILNGWHTWSSGSGRYTLIEVIQRNPLIGVAILIIPISIFLYYLVDKRIKNEKIKANTFKLVLLWILNVFFAVFDLCILFALYT